MRGKGWMNEWTRDENDKLEQRSKCDNEEADKCYDQ